MSLTSSHFTELADYACFLPPHLAEEIYDFLQEFPPSLLKEIRDYPFKRLEAVTTEADKVFSKGDATEESVAPLLSRLQTARWIAFNAPGRCTCSCFAIDEDDDARFCLECDHDLAECSCTFFPTNPQEPDEDGDQEFDGTCIFIPRSEGDVFPIPRPVARDRTEFTWLRSY